MLINVNQTRLHYKVTGNGEPLLFLHGWGCDLHIFNQLVPELARHFTVYALDLPGFGLSPAPLTPLTSVGYAELMQAFMQLLNIKQPVVIGHSFGGKVALHLAAQQLTKSLVLIDSAGILLPKSWRLRLKIWHYKLFKLLKPLLPQKFLLHVSQNAGSSDYRSAHGIMRKILVQTVNENLRPLLSQVTVPTLVIWGEDDTATPLICGKIFASEIKNAQLKVIPNAGHFPFLAEPLTVQAILHEFLYVE